MSVAVLGRPGGTKVVEGELLEVALACRLRVLADDIVLRVDAVAATGPSAAGGLGRLIALLGADRAAELALTGRSLSAHEAVRSGLATLAVPAAELPGAVDDLVAALLATPRDVTAEVLTTVDRPDLGSSEAARRLAEGPG